MVDVKLSYEGIEYFGWIHNAGGKFFIVTCFLVCLNRTAALLELESVRNMRTHRVDNYFPQTTVLLKIQCCNSRYDITPIESKGGNAFLSTDLLSTLLERLSDFDVFLSFFSLYSRLLSSAKNIPPSNLG